MLSAKDLLSLSIQILLKILLVEDILQEKDMFLMFTEVMVTMKVERLTLLNIKEETQSINKHIFQY